MVDALRRARELVTPSGCVIDLHPTAAPALVLVGDVVAGEVDTGSAKVRHQSATDAVAAAVRHQLFTVNDTTEFDFSIYADSIEELQQHIHEDWREGHIGNVTYGRAETLLKTAPGRQPRVGVLAIDPSSSSPRRWRGSTGRPPRTRWADACAGSVQRGTTSSASWVRNGTMV